MESIKLLHKFVGIIVSSDYLSMALSSPPEPRTIKPLSAAERGVIKLLSNSFVVLGLFGFTTSGARLELY